MSSKKSPKIEALVVKAIRRLQDVQGSTPREISNYISQEYDVPGPTIRKQVQLALKRGVTYGILQRLKGGFYTYNRDFLAEQPLDASERGLELPCHGRRSRMSHRRSRSGRRRGRRRGKSRRSRRGKSRSRRRGRRSRSHRRRSRRGRRHRGSRKRPNPMEVEALNVPSDEVETGEQEGQNRTSLSRKDSPSTASTMSASSGEARESVSKERQGNGGPEAD